jgi:hypothetical protein
MSSNLPLPGLLLAHLPQRLQRAGRIKRRAAGERAIQCRPQGIDIARGAKPIDLPRCLLWRHVAGRSQYLARCRKLVGGTVPLGQTKVGHTRTVIDRDQNVLRLQIAVQNAALVRMLNGQRRLLHQAGGLLGRERAVLNAVPKAFPFDPRHGQEVAALVLAGLKDRHNSGMIELRCGRRFCLKTADLLGTGQLPRADDFERREPIQPSMPRKINHAHAAAAHFANQAVVPQSGVGKRHRVRLLACRQRGRKGHIARGGLNLHVRRTVQRLVHANAVPVAGERGMKPISTLPCLHASGKKDEVGRALIAQVLADLS